MGRSIIKKKKKLLDPNSLRSELEDFYASIESDGNKSEENKRLLRKIDMLIERLARTAEGSAQDAVVLEKAFEELRRELEKTSLTLCERIDKLTEKINSFQALSRVDGSGELLSEIGALRKELAEIKKALEEYVGNEPLNTKRRLDVIEKEVENLSLTVDMFYEAVTGNLDGKKAALSKLAGRAESLLESVLQ
ncbi:MAG TPA: hypothetical protein EYH23_00605, partial [Euryarchaeota archaeon]|nr:hypothetical protein [Euryarchaeota archaeon]